MTQGIKEKQMEKKRKTNTKDKDEFLNEVLFSCGMKVDAIVHKKTLVILYDRIN